MNSSAKLWASVSGVSIATAVVIGSIAAASHHTAAPKESPAGQMVSASVTPTPTPTVTAAATSSATPSPVAKLSSSTVKTTATVKPRTVQRQEAPVSNQTTSSNAPIPDPLPANAPGQQLSTGPDGHIVGAPPLPPAPPPAAAPPRMTPPSSSASGG